MKALIGRKVGMTQIINDDGTVIAVTLVEAGPCTVTQVKNNEHDGYDALQLGFGEAKTVKKPQAGHTKQAKVNPMITREFRGVQVAEEDAKVGTSFNVSVFEVGDKVSVTGKSKGKGFAGTVKKYNFATSAKTHGGNGVVRQVGSIGSMYPQKVFKGKKLPSQMGDERVTVKNLHVALVDEEKNLIGITGAVPGPRKGIVTIKGLGA